MSHNDRLNECTAYFHSRPGFQRAFLEMRKKWRSYERVGGTVTLKKLKEEEQQALGGFFSRRIEDTAVSFRLAEFDQALQKTKYAGIHLEELLENYFSEPLISNRQASMNRQHSREQLFRDLLNDASAYDQPVITDWIHALNDSPRSLQSFHTSDEIRASVHSCMDALSRILSLPHGASIPLSVLAMEACGNPHGLDAGTALERLFLRALACCQKRETIPVSAEEKLELLIDCHIRPDDISSFTVVQGIRFFTGEGPHPAYDGFLQKQEYALVSLSQLRSIVSAVPVTDPVFIVENQMVYSELCRQYPDHSIICTSGQLRTASLLVIDLLCQTDVSMHYCGDIDPEGLLIAQKLITRSHSRILPWHMTIEDYHHSCSEVTVSDPRLQELDRLNDSVLIETATELKRIKKAGYQENLIPDLSSDIRILSSLYHTDS